MAQQLRISGGPYRPAVTAATSRGSVAPRDMALCAMSIRIRKLIGTIALLALVAFWALLAMGLAQILVASASPLVAGLYYALVGMGWVLPAMPLVSWMSRPRRDCK